VTCGTVLRPGLHLWAWDKKGSNHAAGGYPDPARLARDAQAFGAVGVLVHAVGTAWPALDYVRKAGGALAGLQVSIALGSRGPAKWEAAFANPCVEALRAGFAVMLDWEGAWDTALGKPSADRCVDKILAKVPDAIGRVTDCPWWAPLRTPNGSWSHPRAPTEEFGRLCALERYPQCYGAARVRDGDTPSSVQGRSLKMLAWARDVTQYPALRTPADRVLPSFQGYSRTPHDVVESLLREPHQLLWQWTEYDGATYQALGAVAALRAKGFTGPDAVREFQRAASLVPDGIVGPKTLAALAA
jgi:hypothetical protein